MIHRQCKKPLHEISVCYVTTYLANVCLSLNLHINSDQRSKAVSSKIKFFFKFLVFTSSCSDAALQNTKTKQGDEKPASVPKTSV